jgi:hypothetical protein
MQNKAFKNKMKSEYSGDGRSKKEAFKKPLTPEDLLELTEPVLSDFLYICHNLPSDEQRQINALSGMEVYDADATALNCANMNGYKWVILHGKQPLAVGGCALLRRGVWQTFMLVPDQSWEDWGKEITQKVIELQKEMKKQGHRIQTLCLSDRAKARAWYDRIGLKHEATLHKYGANGEDVEIYVVDQEG